MAYPGRDSGVFLYIGWRILHGQLPYRDVWDHKPPIIYYIDALGLSLVPGSVWGVWFLEWLALFLAAYLGFRLLKSTQGALPAAFGTFVWLLTSVMLISRGNITEEYALPLQFACLLLVLRLERIRSSSIWLLAFGALSGAAFLTKQTAVGVPIAVVMYLIASRLSSGRGPQLLRELMSLAAGCAAVVIPVIAFFAVQGALRDFWSAVFVFNRAYIASIGGFSQRFVALVLASEPLTRGWLLQLAIPGYVVGAIMLARDRRAPLNWRMLLTVCMIDAPLEFMLAALGGRPYPHYLISALPVLGILAAMPIGALISLAPNIRGARAINAFASLGIMGGILWAAFPWILAITRSYAEQPQFAQTLVEIRDATTAADTVLVWGNETALNFVSSRVSPSRFTYQYPLYQAGYADEDITGQFLSEISQKPPRLIIDTSNPQTPLWNLPIQNLSIREDIQRIQAQYERRALVQDWTIYEYVGDRTRY